jgi:hypothetical protein
LNRPPDVLLGVSPAALAAMTKLEINSVFDLATSGVFDDATKLVRAAEDSQTALNQHGSATSDMLREADAAGKQIGDLEYLPISALQRIPAADAASIQAAFDVDTIRDLALYPPYRAAVKILTEIYFPENAPGFDPDQPPDLLPKTGEYPTERVQYSTLLLDEIPLDDGVQIVDVASASFKPIDLKLLAQADAGFKKTAFGALLTFNQSWYAQGVTLGQLLHSTSLAPGESTRIAVVDWSRKSRAGEIEVIDETDDLTNDQSHNRSISEVTQAVANEAQGGFSATNANSHSTQSGSSSAEELSAPFGGLFGGPSGSFGQTSSEADSSSHADSYSTSWGHRDIGSTMSQNVNDRTHQHAHSNRSRRASVVKEVSQSEHEAVSTRVLANYNHMHALTIQYYEVVQVYRVEVAIVKADRVVFVPFQLVDFNNDDMIRRFQNVLARAAITYGIRQALQNLETLEIVLDQGTRFTVLGDRLSQFAKVALANRTSLAALSKPVAAAAPAPEPAPAVGAEVAALQIRKGFSTAAALSVVQNINEQLWTGNQASRLAGLLNLSVLRPTSSSLFLPTDVLVEDASVDAEGTAVKVIFRNVQGNIISSISRETPVSMKDVGRISLSGSNASKDIQADVVLTLNRNGVRFPVELPSVTIAKGTTAETRLVQVKVGGADVNLKKHLMDNRMYYSQAVFRSLDSTQTALLLSGYGVQVNGETVPVAQVVEPKAIRVVGNYLAFKMNSDASSDETWATWLREHGVHLGVAKEDIVPLGTGGTFAEAVLGRSNCAEKLDITRFWNWQDSPIPLQPSDIAAIQTGSRATNEDVKPGQLSNPIVNITSPTSLPDPMGTAAILSAIQNGSMFRDMSGLQATIGLAQAALQATAAGASTAGQQAGTNMNSLLTANTERQRIAAEMISSLAKTAASAYTGGAAGAGGSGISGGSNHSQDGAKINYFDKTQGQSQTPSAGANSGGAVPPVSGGGQSGGGTAEGGGGFFMNGGTASGGWSQNPGILAATWGDGAPASSLISKAMDYGFSDTPIGLTGDAGTSAGANTKELNLVGQFDWSNPTVTEDDLLAELAAGRWSPATDDFSAVPGGTTIVTPTFGHMLGAIWSQPVGSISRVNLFTHANKDLIGFGGHIEKRTITRADVFINTNGPGDNLTAMDPTSMNNLNQPGVTFQVGTKSVSLEDVRKRFAPGAVIVLYACHSGQLQPFLKSIATFFNVKVVGFKVEIGYYPPAQNVPHKFQRTGMKVGLGFGGAPVTDWRGLTGDSQAITVTP